MKPWIKNLLFVLFFLAFGAGTFFAGSYYANLQNENKNLKKELQKKSPGSPEATEDVEQTSPTGTLVPTTTTGNGSISGELGYPSEHIPALAVYAISTTDKTRFFFVNTADNQGAFTIEDVEPGTYHVVAYATSSNAAGGWSKSVPCGLSVDCKDHSLIPVEVSAGKTATGVEVKDWYAPDGTFPPKPN